MVLESDKPLFLIFEIPKELFPEIAAHGEIF